ncbi:hypothetical protein [Streptomyces acidicola]|uniref:hypothetical protein n=1 Tax=Streptomyces acidicola TaxID=2596892 RepID=UPI003806BA83
MASELVTNAYRHTKGPAALRLRGLDGLHGEPRNGVRVTVWDTDPYGPSLFDKLPARRSSPGAGQGQVEQAHERSLGGRGPIAGVGVCSVTICSDGAGSCSGSSWRAGRRRT